ncbi:MAG: thiazole biosynthesis adenylyltransferase ThiF, partial [Pseudomonadota bacterium]
VGTRRRASAPRGRPCPPCLRCLFDAPPPPGTAPGCDTAGVLNAVIGVVASFQVAEALKLLTGNAERVSRKLVSVDLWTNDVALLDTDRESTCPCCQQRRFDFLDGDAASSATALCGSDAVQVRPPPQRGAVDLAAVATRLAAHGDAQANAFVLRARLREADRAFGLTLFADGRAIVKGTRDASLARSLYARYVGG